MTTVIPGLFQINGVVSTDKSVLQNINAICTAAGCWMTYDITEGKWSVIMNRAGASVASFTDANIIGGITVSGKGINELYNSVTIEFPHKDLRDQTDYIDFDIDSAKRFPNELDNKLNLSTDLANDPIQAQYIAGAELKQSRVDKVIQFRTDFSMLGLKAGDLIDITSSMYGYSAKVFRITKLEEDDSDVLQLSITALEYDADVYSTADLNRKIRSKKTGITPKAANQTLISKDQYATSYDNSQGLSALLAALGGTTALNAFFQSTADASKRGFALNNPGTNIPVYATSVQTVSTSTLQTVYNAYAGNAGGGTGFNGNTSTYVSVSFTLPQTFNTFILINESPLGSYTIYPNPGGGYNARSGFYAYIPTEYKLLYNGSEVYTTTSDWQTQNAIMSIANAPAGTYEVRIAPLVTYDLNNSGNYYVYHSNYTSVANAAGGGFTCTAIGFKI
jgi:hypothetical protein